jgi:hypothetical protein
MPRDRGVIARRSLLRCRGRQPAERSEKAANPCLLRIDADLFRQTRRQHRQPTADAPDRCRAGLVPIDETVIEIRLLFQDGFEKGNVARRGMAGEKQNDAGIRPQVRPDRRRR